MPFPKRKNIRLKNYDYNKIGVYFITICVKQRRNLLWKNDVGATFGRPPGPPALTDIGKIIDAEIRRIGSIYDNVSVNKYVIMPNHVHMIIMLNDSGAGRPQVAPTISRIMQQFKGSISKRACFPVWQKSFYDHVIRNEKDYLKIWEYIDTNELKWQEDCYFREDSD